MGVSRKMWANKYRQKKKHPKTPSKEILFPTSEKLKLSTDQTNIMEAHWFADKYCKYHTKEGCVFAGLCCKDALKEPHTTDQCETCGKLKQKGQVCTFCHNDLPF